MNQELVSQLVRLLPRDSSNLIEAATNSFEVYTNPAIGWRVACAFADARKTFPMTPIERDHWLVDAYMMRLSPDRYYNPHVADAFQITQEPMSGKLKALLIAGLGTPAQAHLDLVSRKTGIPLRTVEAYETLFFNVLDRHADGAYISGIVYPHGRHVELDAGYYDSTPIPELILRAAYNTRDVDFVLSLAGMTDAACRQELATLSNSDAGVELTKSFMGNAHLMTQLGLINQPSPAMKHAITLLATKRAAEHQPTVAYDPETHDSSAELAAALSDVPAPMTDAERAEVQANTIPGRQYFSDETGKVLPMDDLDEPAESTTTDGTAETMEHFPAPIHGVWRNKDNDVPVILIARMSAPGHPDYYLTDKKSGIPASEVFFDNETAAASR